jgi:uncharacterized metal-binding protein YceD (DUF177 family)
VTQKAYVVPLRDLEDGPKTLRQPISDAWLSQQLSDADAAPAGQSDGFLDVTLTKSGRDVLVRGRLAVTVQVPCARTLDPAVYRVTPEVFLLLGPKAGGAAEAGPHRGGRSEERGTNRAHGPRGAAARGTAGRQGTARGAQAATKSGGGGWEEDSLLDEEDAARDTYSGEQVVLDDFLREFILLEIPMVPLREDLRKAPFEATPSPPGSPSAGDSSPSSHLQPAESEVTRSEAGQSEAGQSAKAAEKVDPRLSPLVALKARLEKKE